VISIRLDAYRKDRRRYGKVRYARYEEGMLVYRRVSGGKPGRRFQYYFICGRQDDKSTHEEGVNKQKWIDVTPIATSEERTAVRVKFATILHGIFLFLEDT
jgi:hypothetical protein